MPNYPGLTAEWWCTRGSRSNEEACKSTCVSPSVNPVFPRALFSHCTALGYAFSSSKYFTFPSVFTVLAADIASPRVTVSEPSVNAQSPKLTFSQSTFSTSPLQCPPGPGPLLSGPLLLCQHDLTSFRTLNGLPGGNSTLPAYLLKLPQKSFHEIRICSCNSSSFSVNLSCSLLSTEEKL